jgi:Family of unknown function (DUF5519)
VASSPSGSVAARSAICTATTRPTFSFPKQTWAELRREGRIVPHPVFPDSEGPAARRIETDDDVRDVIGLMRLNYDRAVARNGLPAESGS